MSLRKLSMVIFLNDDVDQAKLSSNAKMGALRLYPEFPDGSALHKVVDISPRMGRAVLFKSEDMLHQAMSTLGWDNYAVTVYFN